MTIIVALPVVSHSLVVTSMTGPRASVSATSATNLLFDFMGQILRWCDGGDAGAAGFLSSDRESNQTIRIKAWKCSLSDL